MESRRCLTSDETTWRASFSSSARPRSTARFMNAAFSMRSGTRRCASFAFIASVIARFTSSTSAISIPFSYADDVLVRVTEGDMPVVGVLVKLCWHGHSVDFRRQRQWLRPHLEISRVPHDAAKAQVRRIAADLVRTRFACFGVDPAQQRLESHFIVGISEKIDEQRHTAAGLLRVTVDRIAFGAPVALERRNGVPHVRRLDELPVEVRRVAPNGELESIGEPLPQVCKGAIEAADWLYIGAKRPDACGDPHDRQRDGRHEAGNSHRPL